jgi:hypothetical protein
MVLDQWAAIMHAKIDQIHNELQMTLDQYDKKFEEKLNYWKINLASQLEQNVGCILTEQLQKYEIETPHVEKACLEFCRLEDVFHSFSNQQLITMAIDVENQMTLNPPMIVCSDIVVDGLNLTENSQEKMDWANQQKNESNDNPIHGTGSRKCIYDFYDQN